MDAQAAWSLWYYNGIIADGYKLVNGKIVEL